MSGRIGFALVDVVLVVVKTLSGPRVGSDLASGVKCLSFHGDLGGFGGFEDRYSDP